MSDIVWQNLPQTNFNDSNQLMQVALQAWDNAYKTAQSTLTDVNKAVNNRNEAQIQAFINSIPKDNWLGSQEAINDKIAQVATQSGNMFDPKVLETYRDGRGTTLLQRQNDELASDEMALNWQNKQLEDDATKTAQALYHYNKTIQNVTDPEEREQLEQNKNSILERLLQDPAFAERTQTKLDGLNLSATETQTKLLTSKDSLAEAEMLSDMPTIEVVGGRLAEIEIQLQLLPKSKKDRTEAQKELYDNLTAEKETYKPIVSALSDKYGNRVHNKFNNIVSTALENYSKKEKENRKIDNDTIRANATITTANAAAQNADTGAYRAKVYATDTEADNIRADNQLELNTAIAAAKAAHEAQELALKEQNLTSKGKGKDSDTLVKMYGDNAKTDGKLNTGYINSQFNKYTDALLQPNIYLKQHQVSDDELSKYRADNLEKFQKLYSTGVFKKQAGFQNVVDEIDKYKRKDGRGLTNWEKKELLSQLPTAKGIWGSKTWIDKQLADLDVKRQREQQAYANQFIANHFDVLQKEGATAKQIVENFNLTKGDAYYERYPKDIKKEIDERYKNSVKTPATKVVSDYFNPNKNGNKIPVTFQRGGVPFKNIPFKPYPVNAPTVGQYMNKGRGGYIPK